MHAELTRAIVEEAQQACRYVAKHNTANMDAGDYRDGFETACAVCEDAIASHVERHKDRIETQLAQDLALRDAVANGTGAMMNGKHVPHHDVFPDFDQQVERAFLAVMNASDRELSLPISAWAERNLLKRRIAVAIAEVLRPQE